MKDDYSSSQRKWLEVEVGTREGMEWFASRGIVSCSGARQRESHAPRKGRVRRLPTIGAKKGILYLVPRPSDGSHQQQPQAVEGVLVL